MTRLEELKATLNVAGADYAIADAAIKSVNVAFEAAYAAEDAYYEELEKQSKAPRKPVEDEGNPLV